MHKIKKPSQQTKSQIFKRLKKKKNMNKYVKKVSNIREKQNGFTNRTIKLQNSNFKQ